MITAGPAVSTIAHQIQLAVAPVFLLAGIGSILNVLAGRLARVVERGEGRPRARFRLVRRGGARPRDGELRILDRG